MSIFRITKRILLGIVIGVVVIVVIVVAVALSSHNTITAVKKPVAPPTSAPPVAAPTTPAPASSPAQSTTGPVGTTFVYTGQDDNGDNISYDVTLTEVDQHAPLAPYVTLTNPGDHLVAARFTIKGVTGQVSDDANSDATATGADTTEYQPSDDDTNDGPNFNYGDWEVGPGQTQTGWVTFEVPAGQSVTQVQWAPFDDDSFVTWNVG
jgi:hypothetical protein